MLEQILQRLEEKMDRQGESLASVNVTLSAQHVELKEHIRRTELNEAGISQIRAELVPLKRAHAMWAGVGKGIAVLATVATIAEAVRVVLSGHL